MDNLQPFLFWVFAGVTGLCAIATVVTQNIVRSATWLLFTLCGAAGIFFLLAADFVAATQLLVYVGGTLVLVIFGVMLTAQGPFISMKTGAAEWAISALVGLLLFGVLAVSILDRTRPKDDADAKEPAAGKDLKQAENRAAANTPQQPKAKDEAHSPYSNLIGLAFAGVEVGPGHVGRGKDKGRTVRTSYLLPFEIVSVHLLVVLIGAAYLARAKRRRGAES